MTWVDSFPATVGPIPSLGSPPLQFIAIPHTRLLLLLTSSSVVLFDSNTLVLLSTHTRTEDSIEKHGYNKLVKTRHVGLNSAQLQKLTLVNLFVETDANFLIIYQLAIDYANSIYNVSTRDTNDTIQKGLPLSLTSKFSLSSLMKSATLSILQGTSASTLNLENIEHFNNRAVEDELGGPDIHPVKISIFKIVKIGLGISGYWLVPNSHHLVVYNDKNEREGTEGAYFQIVDLKTFKSNMFALADFDWYDASSIGAIAYNEFENYFLFVSSKNEVWFLQLEIELEQTSTLAEKLCSLQQPVLLLHFNPNSDLVLLQFENEVCIYRISTLDLKLVKLQSVAVDGIHTDVAWSPCGTFFSLVDTVSHAWLLISKFGHILFNSARVLKELNEPEDKSSDFLGASKATLARNSGRIVVINSDHSKMYSIDLLQQFSVGSSIFFGLNYISFLDNGGALYKVPLLAKFKNVLSLVDHININSESHKTTSGYIALGRNYLNQLSISFGEHLAISTPCGTNRDKNHILWFNFQNHFVAPMNIVGHFWFRDFLVIINRFRNDDVVVDELVALDTVQSKHGQGGVEYFFDTDRIVWRRSFNSQIIAHDLSMNSERVQMLTCVTSDLKILVIEFSPTKYKAKSDSREMTKHPMLFIHFLRTVHLSAIANRLAVSKIIQVSMVYNQHFLFLLGSGEMYMLRSVASETGQQNPIDNLRPAHMYELVQIYDSVSFFKFTTFGLGADEHPHLVVLNGNHVFVHNLKTLVEAKTDEIGLGVEQDNQGNHNIADSEVIRVTADSLVPISLEETTSDRPNGSNSISLIGMQTELFSRQGNLYIQTRPNRQLVLNDFIEKEVILFQLAERICYMFQQYENFDYCLELILFKYLTFEQNEDILKHVVAVIETLKESELIYVNCLRKIEVAYWDLFFKTLGTTPIAFMKRLISNDNVELCYKYLIVYLNFKREEDDDDASNKLDANDKEIILNIIEVLSNANKWDWCFELCRFIKLLEPKGTLLKTILQSFQ